MQQKGAPPHWKLSVRGYLNENLPSRRIGRAGSGDSVLLKWPFRSPDLTPCDFFSSGLCESFSLHPPLPANRVELKQRITSALETVTEEVLQRLWDELDYRLDVCRVAGGACMENLSKFSKTTKTFVLLMIECK